MKIEELEKEIETKRRMLNSCDCRGSVFTRRDKPRINKEIMKLQAKLSQAQEDKKKILEIIKKWRVQLEDVGFITIDKHFIDDLIKKIEKEI